MYFDPKEFGKRLKEIRVIRGMTQEELAELVEVNKQHISRLECGTRTCSIDLLVELSCHLQVSTDYLLIGKEPAREKNREKLLEMISELSTIAKDM